MVARELNHPSAAGWNHYMRTETRRDITIYKKCKSRHLDALFAMGKECHANCYFAMSKEGHAKRVGQEATRNVLGRGATRSAKGKECRAKPSISDRGCLWRMYMDCGNANLCTEIVREFVAVVVMSSAGACTHVTRYRCVLAFIGQRISPSLLLVAVGAVPCGPKRF